MRFKLSNNCQRACQRTRKIAEQTTNRHLMSWVILTVLLCEISVHAQDARSVARAVLPSVVMLEVFDAEDQVISLGSGFFVSADIVVTNYHVIKHGKSAQAHLSASKETYMLEGIFATDINTDLALLKLRGAKAKPLPLADLNALEMGEEVYVFGSPKGLEGSMTAGILSSTLLRKHNGGEFLQITAPVSQGASGGPVVNTRGEVIGVATMSAIAAQNLNFAVPASRISALLTKTGQLVPLGTPPLTDRTENICGDSPHSLPLGKSIEFYIRSGERFYDEQRYAEAKEAYKRAILLDSRNAWSHFALAHIYLKLGCDKRAILANRQAIILDDRNTAYRDGLGWMLINMNRYDEAARVYEEALHITPSHALMRTRLGICYLHLEKISEAIAEFNKALRTDRRCGLAHYWMARAYLKLKDKSSAEQHYRKLATLDAELADELLTLLSERLSEQ